eukprot:gnl/TRDRNA2_/TRDRNA2_80509_c0_seq1.p1 gnl/TRDRNA2_/TRDRNA2_80509_c0~~gnl/TRDRNA2_/TRDRNA2_80509_c0_seq1.p1  ORF type:complete len:493 (-),score=112.48 gnl/TRDRNA2_/TRDRNA2_80509_c0_seq1:48-1526(-)
MPALTGGALVDAVHGSTFDWLFDGYVNGHSLKATAFHAHAVASSKEKVFDCAEGYRCVREMTEEATPAGAAEGKPAGAAEGKKFVFGCPKTEADESPDQVSPDSFHEGNPKCADEKCRCVLRAIPDAHPEEISQDGTKLGTLVMRYPMPEAKLIKAASAKGAPAGALDGAEEPSARKFLTKEEWVKAYEDDKPEAPRAAIQTLMNELHQRVRCVGQQLVRIDDPDGKHDVDEQCPKGEEVKAAAGAEAPPSEDDVTKEGTKVVTTGGSVGTSQGVLTDGADKGKVAVKFEEGDIKSDVPKAGVVNYDVKGDPSLLTPMQESEDKPPTDESPAEEAKAKTEEPPADDGKIELGSNTEALKDVLNEAYQLQSKYLNYQAVCKRMQTTAMKLCPDKEICLPEKGLNCFADGHEEEDLETMLTNLTKLTQKFKTSLPPEESAPVQAKASAPMLAAAAALTTQMTRWRCTAPRPLRQRRGLAVRRHEACQFLILPVS